MGIGFVFLVWVAAAILLLAAYLILSALAKKFPRAALLRKVFVAFVAALAIPLALWVTFNFVAGFFPSRVFESSFGFSPPSTVSELKGSESDFGDSGSAYLCFRTDEATFEKIIRSRPFIEVRPDEMKADYHGGGPNDCWKPDAGSKTRRFEVSNLPVAYQHAGGELLYDESTGRVYFQWDGVD